MQMNAGVEWALHTCLNLGWIEEESGEGAPAGRLAAFYDLPPAYLGKQLQALVKAGILTSTSGPRGGFRLARRLEDVTVLDVVMAIEGRTSAFECAQILHDGPGANPAADYRSACVISQSMTRADLAWRRELASETIADVRQKVLAFAPSSPRQTREWFRNART